ncbi:putative toxin-antitoxin system toxin component, PIN family [Dyella jejuensis]|uniref:Toxin-antitoxin system toxin component, PIN family n=1 Tax=Dyella jejuensis TaxID=1432009 RepID=A0ABW8JK22_9GAMM
MSPALPRYVLDTNVCLDLFVFDDPACASLLAAMSGRQIQAVTRDDCRTEWQAVLSYPQLCLSEDRRMHAAVLFDTHVRCLTLPDATSSHDLGLPRCRDPDDQKFLQLARQAGAVALLTRDDALLRLARRVKREGLFAILPPASWRAAISAP